MAALALPPPATIVSLLRERLANDPAWHGLLQRDAQGNPSGLHLGVFVEPFLQYVLEGKKTIESRFSRRPIAPYRSVSPGEVVLLKASGGPIVGVAQVDEVWNFELDPASWRRIRRDYADALCAQDPHFWVERSRARYATLMALGAVRRIDPFRFPKRDRRGWVCLGTDAQRKLW